MKEIHIRFYEELNDFLPGDKVKKRFVHKFWGNPAVKDLVESLGVPHTEIDLILVNNKSVNFEYKVNGGDDISVYPVFESFDITDVQHLRPEPLRQPKFILDVHLGKLARYMRMMGLDSVYDNAFDDKTIVHRSLNEHRTILTRDLGILKRSEVMHGYFIRNTNAVDQSKEVLERFQLHNKLKLFSRCLECNGLLESVEKEKVIDQVPPKVKVNLETFYRCSVCSKIYWKGTHFDKMGKTLNKILK